MNVLLFILFVLIVGGSAQIAATIATEGASISPGNAAIPVEDLNLISSGLETSLHNSKTDMTKCTFYCKKINDTIPSFCSYSAIFENMCFCGESNVDSLILKYDKTCNIYNGKEPCYFTGFLNGSVYPINRVLTKKDFQVLQQSAPLETNSSLTFNFTRVNIQSQSSDKEIAVDFDGPWDYARWYKCAENDVCTVLQTQTAGTYFSEVYVVNNGVFATENVLINTLHSRINGVEIYLSVAVMEVGVPINASLMIGKGTAMNITLLVNATEKKWNSYDILEKHSLLFPDHLTTLSVIVEDKYYTHDSLVITEDCQLIKLEISAKKTGTLKLRVYKKICQGTTQCLFQIDSCDCGINLLHDGTSSSNSQIPTFQKITDIFVEVSSTGHQIIEVDATLQKENVIGFYGDILHYMHRGSSTVYNITTQATAAFENKIPFINLITTVPFVYNVPSPEPVDSSGEVTYTVDVNNPLEGVPITVRKTLPYQTRITVLKFVNELHFNVRETSTIEMFCDGDPVDYIYDIETIGVTTVRNSPNHSVVFQSPGTFQITVTASNLINNLTMINEVIVDAPIILHQINISNDITIIDGVPIPITVKLIGGLDVHATLFSESFPETGSWIIPNATAGHEITMNATFDNCGEILIESYARNNFSSINTSKVNITVQVFCSLGDLKIIPSINEPVDGALEFSKTDLFSLDIDLTSGYFVTFNVSWGDGTYYIKDQTNLKTPKAFVAANMYEPGNYTVVVTATTLQGGSVNYTVDIRVLLCVVPKVTFNYGSSDTPIDYLRADDALFTGTWTYPSVFCQTLISPHFLIKKWDLQDSNNHSLKSHVNDAFKMDDTQHNRVTYTISKKSLPAGDYTLTLVMEYQGKVSPYTAYISIIKSPLVAEIKNGNSQTIPFKVLKEDGNMTYYNFTIDGSLSKDPDEAHLKTAGLSFLWECRIVSSEFEVNRTVSARKNLVKLTYKADTCFNTNWTKISGGGNDMLTFNSEMFLEGLSYQMRLTVEKDTRKSGFQQTIKISSQILPPISTTCIQCQEKLNTMHRTIFEYKCPLCPGNSRLVGIWHVYSDDEAEWSNNSRTSTGYQNPNLVINPFELRQNANYTFKLLVGFVGSPDRSTFSFNKRASSSPTGGSCTVSPRRGTVMDKFSIRCSHWSSVDKPTIYEFRYNKGGDDDNSYPLLNINNPNLPELLNTNFPVGRKENNYEIKINIKIINRYGQYVELPNIPVQVNPIDMSSLLSLGNISNSNSSNNTTVEPSKSPPDKTAMLKNVLSSIQPDDPKDPQQVASAVLQKISIMEIIKEDDELIAAARPLTDPLTNMPFEKGEKELQKENEEKEMLQKETESMLDMISIVSMTALPEVKSIADAIVGVTSNGGNLTPYSQEKASTVLETATSALLDFSESTPPDLIEEALDSVLASVSNLFDSQIESISGSSDERGFTGGMGSSGSSITSGGSSDGTGKSGSGRNGESGTPGVPGSDGSRLSNKVKKSIKENEKLMGILDKTLYIIGNSKVTGETSTKIETKAFNFIVEKRKPYNLSHAVVSQEFKLPSFSDMFDDVINEDVSTEVINFKENIFIDMDTSNYINSIVSSLDLRVGSKKLKINNTANPFEIKLDNQPEKLKSDNLTLYIPGHAKIQTINLESNDCNLMVSIDPLNDFNNETKLHVLLQFGKAPTEKEYQIKFTISNKTPMSYSIKNGSSFIKPLEGNSFLLWNFNESSYGKSNDTKVYLSMYYDGPMPDLIHESNLYTYDSIEERGSFNYSLKSNCAYCRYWNRERSMWTEDGCQIVQESSSWATTTCHCNHLTAFGSFFVKPNSLPPLSFALLKEGYVLMVTVASCLLLYVVGLVFARKADIGDKEKIGVMSLVDNQPKDQHLYKITVNTGTRSRAGTTSNVYFDLTGENNKTGIRRMKSKETQSFSQSSSLVFVMSTEEDLGDLLYLRLWHDNSGGGWYVRNVQVLDLQTGKAYIFLAGRWLAVDMGDGLLDCLLSVTSDEELQAFNYIFANQSMREISDGHIWFSIYGKPPISPFTRCQRLSVAMSLLFSVMLANIMFYRAVPKGTPETENNIQGFKFTLQQVFVVVVIAVITLPVNMILIALFKSIKPYKESKSVKKNEGVTIDSERSSEFDKLSSVESGVSQSKNNKIDEKDTAKKDRQKRQLPYWMLYPTWFFCIFVVFGCAFFVIWYGMAFGNQKSLDWLASVTVNLIQDILLIQPIKALLFAVVVAVFVKKLETQERKDIAKEVEVLIDDENWCDATTSEEKKGLFDRTNTESLLPPNAEKLSKLRLLKYKETQLRAITKELMLYIVFTAVVAMLGFSLRDYQAFYQTRDIEEMMNLVSHKEQNYNFVNAGTKDKVWEYLEKVLLVEIFPDKWFDLDRRYENESFYDFPGLMYLNDLTSKIVTGARLRQLRVKENTCIKERHMNDVVKIDCAGHYGMSTEQQKDYDHNWFHEREYVKGIHPRNMPWRFQEATNLDGYPFQAEIGTYYGGGYVAELFPKWNNKALLQILKQRKWLDRHTRALFIEFAVFNGATNYFDSVNVVFEFPPWGGVVHYSTVTTFKLYVSSSSYAFFVFISQILFLCFTVLFMVREARVLYKQGCRYFMGFWNLIEFSNIIFSLTVIAFFFWRNILAKEIASRLPEKSPENYINLQFTSMVDQFMTYIFALICFCVTVKFMKLLRFNKRISMLSATLKRAWYPLMMFGIQYAIILFACTLFSTLAFGRHLYGYKDNFSSFTSVMSLLLGKFSYYQFESTNRFLGPIFFFGFNMFVNWIVMNMYISILNDVLSEVYAELESQTNEYEMVEFMLGNLKEMIGFPNGERKAFQEALDAASEEKQKHEKVTTDPDEKNINENKLQQTDKISPREIKCSEKDSFTTHLSTEENLGVAKKATQANFDEILKPSTRKLDSKYKYLFQDSELDEIDEEYIINRMIQSMGIIAGQTVTANISIEEFPVNNDKVDKLGSGNRTSYVMYMKL